jgi:hypothetical protein
MNRIEAGAQLRIITAIAQADGEIDPDEKVLLSEMGGDPSKAMERVRLDDDLALLQSTAAKLQTLRAATAMAEVDGKCSKSERRLLERIAGQLGLATDAGAQEEIENERANLAHMREELESATTAFLREVAAKGATLTQPAYEMLVRELDKAKRTIIHTYASRAE